jgi:hypothetical protein
VQRDKCHAKTQGTLRCCCRHAWHVPPLHPQFLARPALQRPDTKPVLRPKALCHAFPEFHAAGACTPALIRTAAARVSRTATRCITRGRPRPAHARSRLSRAAPASASQPATCSTRGRASPSTGACDTVSRITLPMPSTMATLVIGSLGCGGRARERRQPRLHVTSPGARPQGHKQTAAACAVPCRLWRARYERLEHCPSRFAKRSWRFKGGNSNGRVAASCH